MSSTLDDPRVRSVLGEMHEGKAARARDYIAAAGLADLVDVHVGNALVTVRDVNAGVTLVFLDGWKEPYLPFLATVEHALLPGAFVVADDLDLFPDALRGYLAYVRDPAHGYVSVTLPVGDAMEISVRAR